MKVYRPAVRLMFLLLCAMSAAAQTVTPSITFDPAIAEPGHRVRVQFSADVTSRLALVQTKFDIPASIGEFLFDPGAWTCVRTDRSFDCSKAEFAGGVAPPAITFLAPALGNYRFTMSATVPGIAPRTASATLNVAKVFRVLHGRDAGAGSLRQAFADVNGGCAREYLCRIVFDIGAGHVQLATPLPPLAPAGPLMIDGAVGEALWATIDGSAVDGNGIEFRGSHDLELRSLSIYAFGGDGLTVVPPATSRVSLEAMSILRNRFRGVSFYSSGSLLMRGVVVSENGYSGVALWRASTATILSGSFERNGASGLFVWDVGFLITSASCVANAQFGMAIVPGRWPIRILASGAAYDNGIRNVDWGLDGESPPDADEKDGIPNVPELLEARYDPATRRTTVRGRVRTIRGHWGPEMQGTFIAGPLQPDGTARSMRAAETFTLFNDYTDSGIGSPYTYDFTFSLRDARPGDYVSVYGIYFSVPSGPLNSTEVSRAILVE